MIMKRASRMNAAPLLLSLILSAPLTITLTITADNNPPAQRGYLNKPFAPVERANQRASAAITSTTQLTSETPAVQTAEQNPELAFINDIVNKTIIHIDSVQNAFKAFLSKKDTRTYDAHVEEMCTLINAITAEIYLPSQQTALEAPDNKMYQVAWNIASELCAGLQHMYRVLDKHRPTTNILNFSTDLKGATAELQIRCTKLPAQVDELIALVGKQDMELKGKLLALRIKLNQLLTSNGGNSLAILEILRFRKTRK
jgi:hypothetical protein